QKPETWVGTPLRGSVDPFPSCPTLLLPQHSMSPFRVTAHAVFPPTETSMAPLASLVTGTGDALSATADPFPSCPSSLAPSHTTPPVEVIAHSEYLGNCPPTDSAVTPLDRPGTAIAVELFVFMMPGPTTPQH